MVRASACLSDDFSPSCANNAGAHPDLAFSFTITADADVLLSASPRDGQALSIALFPISNGACGVELLCGAAVANVDAELAITNLGVGRYAIVIDGNSASVQAGDFSLTFVSAPTVIGSGDLVINEIQANPPGTTVDTGGEYLEIANPSTNTAVGTAGLTITDGTTTINPLAGAGGAQLLLPPGSFIVGVHDLNPANNGGINNGSFVISFGLNNTPGDIFTLAKGGNVIDLVNTTSANPNGAFSNAIDGISLQLDPPKKTAALNDNKSNWCSTPTALYGTLGGRGTPGLENQFCTAPQCTVATQATDCNDNNACTNDLCTSGVCQHPANNAAIPAGNGLSCTVESCAGGSALHTPNDLACDDGVPCTDDVCLLAGGAANTGCKSTANDNNCGVTESCDPLNDCQLIGFCGDGIIEVGEACDDGNFAAGDGCDGNCAIEPGFSCTGAPSFCVSPCGNGVVDAGEECDDNNLTSGDGCSNACTAEALFFSEYVEGTGNSKAVELKNPLSAALNLTTSACQVRVFTNGALTPSATIALAGTINANSTFVLCNPGGTIPAAQCNQNSGSLNMNGNDALELRCTLPSVVTLDVIGQIGFDPGVEWGTGNRSTADNTIRRKCNRVSNGAPITHGDTNGGNDFNNDLINEWVGFANNTFDGLGLFACEP